MPMALQVTRTRIKEGRWEGVIDGADAPPEIEVLHLEKPLEGVTVTPIAGERQFALSVPIPVESLSDGVQTYVIRAAGGEKLAAFSIVTGVPMEDDIRAEVDLLRAELDMLKRAFRRHCLETGG
jgi:hypothetical protein